MDPRLRILSNVDRDDVLAFLDTSPIENLFLSSKIEAFGLDRRRLGIVLAYESDNGYSSVLLDGGTVVVAGFDPDALPAFVDYLGPSRQCSSILGPAVSALGLFLGLGQRWGRSWNMVSNVRRHQPLMLLEHLPTVEPDLRVKLLTIEDYESYLDASVSMYTEEIGSSPFKYGPGYEQFVFQRLQQQDAYGIVSDGKVIFKADLGPKRGGQSQLQGVWVSPELRGTGLSVPALAGMLNLAMQRFPQISLYVNDFNTPALRAYQRLGFSEVGALATVHY